MSSSRKNWRIKILLWDALKGLKNSVNVMSLGNLAMLTGNVGRRSTGVMPLRGQNNVQGACDMGALPNVYVDYQPVGTLI
jgi:predicted molibdopterin-dependent oxidoreductase YjgC